MSNADISLAIGGISDECGLRGLPLPADEHVGLIGINGLCCTDCYLNFGRFAPRWGAVVLDGSRDLGVYTVTGHLEGPFFGGDHEGLVIIDPEWRYEHTPEAVTTIFDGLRSDEQQLVYELATDEWRDSIVEISVPDAAVEHIRAYHHRDNTEASPYTVARSQLPAPYAVTPRGIYCEEASLECSVETIEEALARADEDVSSETGRTRRANLSDFESADSGSEDSTASCRTENKSASDTTENKTGQAGLDAF